MSVRYAVCPLRTLEEAGWLGAKWKKPPREKKGKTEKEDTHPQKSPNGAPEGFYALEYVHPATGDLVKVHCNARGRMILAVNKGREIFVFYVPKPEHMQPQELAALRGGNAKEKILEMMLCEGNMYGLDRNCYHVGYPLDMGDIEDYPNPNLHQPMCAAKEKGLLRCINCPLHNRIFDLSTGDMMALTARVSSEGSEEWTPASTGCYQRVHQLSVLTMGELLEQNIVPQNGCFADTGRKEADELWIVVEDSHGNSNPLPASEGTTPSPGVRPNEEVVYIEGQKVPSDSYNRPDGVQRTDGQGVHPSKEQRITPAFRSSAA